MGVCCNMNILCIGDVCGNIGCNALAEKLHGIKKQYNIDLTIVNGENSADGNGITPDSADFLFSIGADVITGGNHTLRRTEFHPYLDEKPFVLRPDNLEKANYGSGYCLIDLGKYRVAVINLLGNIYLESQNASNPFNAADLLIARAKDEGANVIIIDFHAEATSEKRALGIYCDGRISALFGSHTHVQTADCQLLPNGTAYITDIGMTGPIQSVLGVKSDIIISRLRHIDTKKFELADGECMINGCVFTIDEKSGKATACQSLYIK